MSATHSDVADNLGSYPGSANAAFEEECVEVLDQGSSRDDSTIDAMHAKFMDEPPTMTTKRFPAPLHSLAPYLHATDRVSETAIHEECEACPDCDGSSSTNANISGLRRLVNHERPHFCVKCNKTFRLVSQLKIHERIHRNERPYMCQYCRKGFKQPSNLTQHLRIHTGERPYRCSYCDKAFKQKSQVMQHERLHTGSKPYVCKLCQRGFVQLSQLQSHEKAHRERNGRLAKRKRGPVKNSDIHVDLMSESIVNPIVLN